MRRPGWLGKCWCACLTLTLDRLLDEPEQDLDKASVLKAARQIHKRPPRKRKPKAQPPVSEPLPVDEEPAAFVPEPLPVYEADKDLVTQTPTKPLRTRYEPLTGREWLSEKSRSQSIVDKIF